MTATSDALAEYVYFFAVRKLAEQGYRFENHSVSAAKLVELLNYARRDLARIAIDLKDHVSRQKYAAYHAFWFAKVAPISDVRRPDEDTEVVDINERLAIHLMHDLLVSGLGTSDEIPDVADFEKAQQAVLGYDVPAVPQIWFHCTNKCVGQCFTKGFMRHMVYHSLQNYEYLVHSLRHRAVGPYDLVNLLESLTINSCEMRDQIIAV